MDARAPANLVAEAQLLGVELSSTQVDLLAGYIALLVQWNKRINLLSRRDIGRIWPRHVLDSLSILPFIKGPRILDLGSGGGLPGIPLAIAAPQHTFTLLDRSDRKTRFLEHVVLRLGLANVIVTCADVTDRTHCNGETVAMSTIVSRAVAEPARIWQMAQGWLAANGIMVLMSAVNVRPDLRAAHVNSSGAPSRQQDTAPRLAGVWQTLHRIDIPGLDQQHEVLVFGQEG